MSYCGLRRRRVDSVRWLGFSDSLVILCHTQSLTHDHLHVLQGDKNTWFGAGCAAFCSSRASCAAVQWAVWQCSVCQSCVAQLAASARGAMNTTAVVASARLRPRLWSYALAEAIPKSRQRLHIAPEEAGTSSRECSSSVATFRIDAALAARLSDERVSRGVPLASILLSSLFLAAARAARLEQEDPPHGTLQNRPMGVRAQRGFILGIVCLVMALLSGSAESKVMRYFCSIYGVVAGEYTVYGQCLVQFRATYRCNCYLYMQHQA